MAWNFQSNCISHGYVRSIIKMYNSCHFEWDRAWKKSRGTPSNPSSTGQCSEIKTPMQNTAVVHHKSKNRMKRPALGGNDLSLIATKQIGFAWPNPNFGEQRVYFKTLRWTGATSPCRKYVNLNNLHIQRKVLFCQYLNVFLWFTFSWVFKWVKTYNK